MSNQNNNNLKQHRVDTGNDPAYDLVNENWSEEQEENFSGNNNNPSDSATLFVDSITNSNDLSFPISNDSSKTIHFGSKLAKFSSSSMSGDENVVSSIKMALPILSNFFSSSTSATSTIPSNLFCFTKVDSTSSSIFLLSSSSSPKPSSSSSNTPPQQLQLALSSVVKKLRSEILPSCNFHVPLTPMLIGLGTNPAKISTTSTIEKSSSRPRRSVSSSNNNNNNNNTRNFLMMSTTTTREKLNDEDLWWWLKSESGCPRHGPFACACRNWAAEAFLLFGLSCEVDFWNLKIRPVGDEEETSKNEHGNVSSSKLKNNSRKAQQQRNNDDQQKSSRRFDADAIDQRNNNNSSKMKQQGEGHNQFTASSSSEQKQTVEQQVQEMKIKFSERTDHIFEIFVFFMMRKLENESCSSSFLPVITLIIGQDVPEPVTENSVFDANEKYLSEKIIAKLKEEEYFSQEETHLPPIILVCITTDGNNNNKKSTAALFYLVDERKILSETVAGFFSSPSATSDQIRYVKYSARILSQQPNISCNNTIKNDKQIQDIIESLQEGLTSCRDFYHHYFSSHFLWGKILNKNKNHNSSNAITNQNHLSSSSSSLLLRRCSWCNLLCARQWVGKVPQQGHRICVDCDRILCGCPQTGCNHRCVRCGRAVCGMCCEVVENVDGVVDRIVIEDDEDATTRRNGRSEDSCFGLFEARVCRTCGEN